MKRALVLLPALVLASGAAFAQTAAPQPAAPPAATTTGNIFYNRNATDVRASKLIGSKVMNAANENVGDINEVILSGDGKVAAVVIGVGGFLGLGEREVAMDYNALKFAKDSNGRDVVTINATKDQLKEAPAWTWPTTGTTTTTPSNAPAKTPAR